MTRDPLEDIDEAAVELAEEWHQEALKHAQGSRKAPMPGDREKHRAKWVDNKTTLFDAINHG